MIFAKIWRRGAPLLLALGLLAPCGASLAQTGSDLVNRGKYLTAAGGCVSCHTDPGGEAFAGNREIQTPFGAIYSPNITPDKDTGIGAYTDEQFYKALHDGLMANGEYLYPAMPFTSFTKVKRDDVLAIKAYLFSLKPVHSEEGPASLLFRSIFAKAWRHGGLSTSSPANFSQTPVNRRS